jgi:hypothetical protein
LEQDILFISGTLKNKDMKQYTIQELKAEFTRLGYKWFPYHFVGVRSKANLPNQFDDLFALIQGDNIRWFTCTTNPGTHWLKNILNPKGAALLKPNQYVDTWEIGLHQGKYEAFRQCKPVEVYRDGDKDDVAEETSVIDKGLFGINIHRANEKAISKLIDKWSAGCQVLNNPADFALLLSSAKESKQKHFTYTLLREF